MDTRSKRRSWCFTLNNYTNDHQRTLRVLAESENVEYMVFGREVANSRTPHLQGYVIFVNRKTFNQVRQALPGSPHIVFQRGTNIQASLYCKKDGDFEEFGTLPPGQGARVDISAAQEYIKNHIEEHNRIPTEQELSREHPLPFIKYRDGLMHYARAILPTPVLRDGDPRPWQSALAEELLGPSDDRKVIFYVDPVGNSGKTWFQQWFVTRHAEITQILGCAKRDDMAYTIDETKRVYLLNVARSEMKMLQYPILEQIKDRVMPSPKYQSRTKLFTHIAHVVVFCNELPVRENSLSIDRFDVRRLDEVGGEHIVHPVDMSSNNILN